MSTRTLGKEVDVSPLTNNVTYVGIFNMNCNWKLMTWMLAILIGNDSCGNSDNCMGSITHRVPLVGTVALYGKIKGRVRKMLLCSRGMLEGTTRYKVD